MYARTHTHTHKWPTQTKSNSSTMFAFDFYIKSKSCNLFVDICLHIRTSNGHFHLLGTALNVYRVFLLTTGEGKKIFIPLNYMHCTYECILTIHVDKWEKKKQQHKNQGGITTKRNRIKTKQNNKMKLLWIRCVHITYNKVDSLISTCSSVP